MTRGFSRTLLASLLTLVPTAPHAAKTTPDPSLGEWVLEREVVEPGKILRAWLRVPVENSAHWGIADIELPPGAVSWVVKAGEDCGTSGPQPGPERFEAHNGLLRRYCVRFDVTPGGRLVASLRFGASDAGLSHAATTRLIASPLVTVAPAPPNPLTLPTTTAIIAAVSGLFAGVITAWAKSLLERRHLRRVLSENIVLRLVEYVCPKIVPESRAYLQRVIEGTENPEPFAIGGLHGLMKDGGALAFLQGRERKAYLEKLKRIYEAINNYNAAASRDAVTLESRARELKALLDDLYGALGT